MTDCVRIPVSRYRRHYGDALVDAEDDARLRLSEHFWVYGTGYAVNHALGPMHRVILGLAKGEQRFAHHVNEDPLDNRKANLQVFDSRSEANSQPHPKRDERTRQSRREREAEKSLAYFIAAGDLEDAA